MSQKSFVYRPLIVIGFIFLLTIFGIAAEGNQKGGNGKGSLFTHFEAAENWDYVDMSEMLPLLSETIRCAGSELSINFEQPCPPGVNIKMRNLTAPGFMMATDPRMTGAVYYQANGNFDPEYAGPVWGTWILLVDGEEGIWEGTWQGKRRISMDPEECLGMPYCWIGNLHLVGHGSGGSVEGLQVKAEETVRTFSGLPAPYENICMMIYGGPCPLQEIPEGMLSGRILEPGKHK